MAKKLVSDKGKHTEPKLSANRMPAWLLFLAYLAYLRATQPQRSTEGAILRLLIVVTALVLIALILLVGGDPSAIPTVIKNWHL